LAMGRSNMDPDSKISKLDQSVKALLILAAGFSVCVGFFLKLIDTPNFMPFVYLVVGAAFGRASMGSMTATTKTTDTVNVNPDGSQTRVTSVTAPLGVTPVVTPATAPLAVTPAPPDPTKGPTT
jgi:hypothetical protein